MAVQTRQFVGAENMSEFVSGRHGTCGELATLAALHVVRPDEWPMNAASLERITTWAIAQGLAGNPSGAEAPGAVRAFLTHVGIAWEDVDVAQLAPCLAANAGLHPVILEYANAQALPGDEQGVHYHYNTCLGTDLNAPAYVFADGDNYSVRVTHGLGPLDKYPLAVLEAAQPVSIILVQEWAMIDLTMPEVGKYFSEGADGASWTCTNGRTLRGGMLPYYRSLPSLSGYAGLFELGLPLTDESPVDRKFLSRALQAGDPIPVLQRFERGVRLYDPQHLVDSPVGDTDASGIYPAHIDIEPGMF